MKVQEIVVMKLTKFSTNQATFLNLDLKEIKLFNSIIQGQFIQNNMLYFTVSSIIFTSCLKTFHSHENKIKVKEMKFLTIKFFIIKLIMVKILISKFFVVWLSSSLQSSSCSSYSVSTFPYFSPSISSL